MSSISDIGVYRDALNAWITDRGKVLPVTPGMHAVVADRIIETEEIPRKQPDSVFGTLFKAGYVRTQREGGNRLNIVAQHCTPYTQDVVIDLIYLFTQAAENRRVVLVGPEDQVEFRRGDGARFASHLRAAGIDVHP